MNTRLLAYEYILAVGITSWAAIRGTGKGSKRERYAPWPPTIVFTSISFGILSLLAGISAPLAGSLGAGFMLATLVKVLGDKDPFVLSGMPLSRTFQRYNYAAITL